MIHSSFLLLFVIVCVSAKNESPYSEQWASDTAYLAGFPYCSPSILKAWNCTPCKKEFPQFVYAGDFTSKYSDFGIVGHDPSRKVIVVSFRGTSNAKNWIQDLMVWKEQACWWPDKIGTCQYKVHSGFYEGYLEMRTQVHNLVQPLLAQYPDYLLMVTGHSLGGALASLFTVDLATTTFNDTLDTSLFQKATSEGTHPPALRHVESINFGTPRVGNLDWSQFLDDVTVNYYRVVHYHDIVPMIPLEEMNFHHPPTEVWYNEENCQPNGCPYKVCSTTNGEDPTCQDSVGLLHASVADHSLYLGRNLDCQGEFVG